MTQYTECRGCEEPIERSRKWEDALLCSGCRVRFSPEKGIQGRTGRMYFLREYFSAECPFDGLLLCEDGNKLQAGFEALEGSENLKERLYKLLDTVRPLDPRFCEYSRFKKEMCYHYEYREIWMRCFFSWCLPPNHRSIDALLEFIGNDAVLEVGAGAGLYAKILQTLGVEIRPTDIRTYDTPDVGYFADGGTFSYLPIESISADDAVMKYGDDHNILLGIWPRSSISLEAFSHFKGQKIIIIGEPDGGCTASLFPRKYEPLSDSEDEEECISKWVYTGRTSIPDWYGINSVIKFYSLDQGD